MKELQFSQNEAPRIELCFKNATTAALANSDGHGDRSLSNKAASDTSGDFHTLLVYQLENIRECKKFTALLQVKNENLLATSCTFFC